MKTKKITMLGVMLSASIVLSIVDSQISAVMIPSVGVKLGLANVVTLLIMYLYDTKSAFLLAILRIILVAILMGATLVSFALSFAGGMSAFLMMALFKKLKIFSIIGVSISGAFGHSVGQILTVMFIVEVTELIYSLPYILTLSVITGVLTGMVSKLTLNTMEKAL